MLTPDGEDERPWLAFLAEGMRFAGRRSVIDLTVCYTCVSDIVPKWPGYVLPFIVDRVLD